MVNDSHTQRSQFFNVDAIGRGGYGKLSPCVDFVPEHDGPQIKVAMNGVKNKQFNFPNCELDQWYNLTISQEEINENKYKFTATVTELADEGDTESEGEFKTVFSAKSMLETKYVIWAISLYGPYHMGDFDCILSLTCSILHCKNTIFQETRNRSLASI